MRFSQRHGYTPVSSIIQVESMNEDLRNSLWNTLDSTIFERPYFLRDRFNYGERVGQPEIYEFSRLLWSDIFKKAADLRPDSSYAILQAIRNWFFTAKWFDVYDFIEFAASQYSVVAIEINAILERELAGYRLIGGVIAPIVDAVEVSSVEAAISARHDTLAHEHIKRALELLSDKKTPDYRNSIKESISAVECIARHISQNDKATLGDALKIIEKRDGMHPALKDSFIKLYGYTSDSNGIRHSLLEQTNLSQADAIYFLVSCSAFVNLLRIKNG